MGKMEEGVISMPSWAPGRDIRNLIQKEMKYGGREGKKEGERERGRDEEMDRERSCEE